MNSISSISGTHFLFPLPNITQISFSSTHHSSAHSTFNPGMALDGLNQAAYFVLVAAVTGSGMSMNHQSFLVDFQDFF